MITWKSGNIFESKMQTIVNPVNCVGVMGKGLALQFKSRFPWIMEPYVKACKQHALRPGKLMLLKRTDPWIMLFPTKDHWNKPSELSYVEEGLKNFVNSYESKGVTSVAFTMLGCGNGGLNRNNVKEMMIDYLEKLPIEIEIYI